MPRSQTAADRPIAFALHDTVRNTAPELFQMNIRPEDLSRIEQSRMTVNQTLGGAWIDSFGPGVPTVNLSGTTGWGAGGMLDGFDQFKKLHATVFERWHKLREDVIKEGKDPGGIILVFSDGLDDFVWPVAPQNFTLRRNKSRPLLSQYQIAMVKTGDTLPKSPPKPAKPNDLLSNAGLSSLDQSLKTINDFAKNIKGQVAAALGPLKTGIDGLVKQASSALSAVRSIVATGMNVANSVAGPVLEIAQSLTKVAANVFKIASSTKGLPMTVKQQFMQVGSAFNNAHCLMRNAFKMKGALPQYSNLYGASNCSSTSGGRAVSPFVNTNVLPSLFPAAASPVALTARAEGALNTLAAMDPLKASSLPSISGLLNTVNNGVSISADVVDKAIASAKSAVSINFGGVGLGTI